MKSAPLLLGALGALTLLLAAASPPGRRLVKNTMSWTDRVIARVTLHEGRHDSLNLNADSAGLSFGILQWAQKPGGLGVLLRAMHDEEPERFLRTFGPHTPELLATTARGSLAPVGGAVLWAEPWVSRFRAAGRDPVFVTVQNRLAAHGEHFRGALDAAAILGVHTERAMALFYDTAVQQGPAFARRLAERVRDEMREHQLSYADVLARYAALAPAGFRRTSPPTAPHPSSHIEWRRTGDAWHAWAGRFDLYAGIVRRRTGILNDPDLSDEPIQQAMA